MTRESATTERGLNTYIQIYGWSVGEAMNSHVISIAPDTDVGRVGKLMLLHKIKRVPVIDHGHLVGIISRCDLLSLVIDAPSEKIARDDDALRLAVATRLATDLGLSSDKVTVTVNPASLTTMNVYSTSVIGPTTATLNTVVLSGKASAGGAVVGLSSSNPSVVQVPASVTVAADQTTSPTFNLTTSLVPVATMRPCRAVFARG